MRPANTKQIFEFITGEMHRLRKKEISVDEAKTQCMLAGQAINILNYELKRALIGEKVKVLDIETGRGLASPPDGSSAELMEEEKPNLTTTFTVEVEAEPELPKLIVEPHDPPIEYKLITPQDDQWFVVLFPLIDGGNCTMVEYKAPSRQDALDHARERFGRPRIKTVTSAEYINERGYYKLRITEKIDLTVKPIYAFKL